MKKTLGKICGGAALVLRRWNGSDIRLWTADGSFAVKDGDKRWRDTRCQNRAKLNGMGGLQT